MSNDTEVSIHNDEFTIAKEQTDGISGTTTIHLRKPFTYEEHTFEELTFDWNRLTGEDALAIEDEVQALNKAVIVPVFSGEFLVRMAARACVERIGQDVLRALPIADFNKVRNAARSFLLKSEL